MSVIKIGALWRYIAHARQANLKAKSFQLTGRQRHVNGRHQVESLLSRTGRRLTRRRKPGRSLLTLFCRRKVCVERHSLAAVRVEVGNIVIVVVVIDVFGPGTLLAAKLQLALLLTGFLSLGLTLTFRTESWPKRSQSFTRRRLTFRPQWDPIRICAVVGTSLPTLRQL